MNLRQRIKLLKHFGSEPPEPKPPLLVVPKPGMEELTIWEQHTITLNKDPRLGFGFALSGGKDKPQLDGDTAVMVSDVLPNGPAMGRLFNKDQIVMVNGVNMENAHSNYTIQILKTCGKIANITVKRPRKIQIPATSRPTRAASHSNLLDQEPPRRTRRFSDGSDQRDATRYHTQSSSPDRNGYGNSLSMLSSGYKRLPQNSTPDRPVKTTLVKKKITDEYGLKLGSQIFIKHMSETGLAAREGTLQEGDLILKINGMTTENLSLLETKHLVEKSRGKLTMTVLRDDRKFLVSIPEVEDSAPNSENDQRRDSSSELEDISDIEEDITPRRTSRQHTREKRTRRTRAEPSPRAKSRDSSPVRSSLARPAVKTYAPRRVPSESDTDQSATPPPPVRRSSAETKDPSSKYKYLSGVSTLPNPRSSPVHPTWATSRPSSSASRPRKPVSESDSDHSVSPPLRRESPHVDNRYKSLSDLPPADLGSTPIPIRQEPLRRVNSPVRIPPPDSESDSDSAPPRRLSSSYGLDTRYRDLPEVTVQPQVEPPRWTATSSLPQKAHSDAESEASYASVPPKSSTESENSRTGNTGNDKPKIVAKKSTAVVKQDPPRHVKSPSRPRPDDSSESDELSHLRRSGSSEREDDHRHSAPRAANGSRAVRSGISVKNNPALHSKPVEEPLYFLPPDSYPSSNPGYSSDVHTVRFVKQQSLGLRLVGGNDVGIFVGGVQPNSPAYEQGMKEGDQILQVNTVDFGHFTREEAANFLLKIPPGERVEICTQTKMDIYKKIIKSNLGDNFYIRTHFDHEVTDPKGLSFTRGEVFRVVDTMYRGKIGNWLAIRMGNDLHEMDKGIMPNQDKAEKLATIERTQRSTGERTTGEKQVSGPRAEFWKLRGLRGNKKNEKNRRSRDDLLQLTIQGNFPAYERVLLREANFKRPIVILGPLNDIAMEKLAREMPDEYEVAEMVPRSGVESSSTVIKLDTVRRIAEKDKHPLLDITPTAVERLNYIQYHPMVLFLDPHSRKDVKSMRQKYNPNSNKSSRRLYSQALKMRKHCSHLFSARIDLMPGSNSWYESLKEKIRHQQSKPVWVSEVTLESGQDQDLDALDQNQTDYLSAASDLEDTDGEALTDDAYTDNEDVEEAYPGQEAARHLQSHREAGAALARSSEPAFRHDGQSAEAEASDDTYSERELPPLMHVPEPRSPRHRSPQTPEEEEEEEDASQRSFSDSDFNIDFEPHSPSDGPPDFVAPDPMARYSVDEPPYEEEQPESLRHASLSAIEDKLEKTRMAEPQAVTEAKKGPAFIVLAHHHQAVQYRRTQIRGSDSSEDEDDNEVVVDEEDDIEWGPATEL